MLARFIAIATLIALSACALPTETTTTSDQFSSTVTITGVPGFENPLGGTAKYWFIRSFVDKATHVATHQLYLRLDYLWGWRFYESASTDGRIPDAELNVLYFSVQPVWTNMGNTPTERMRIRVDWGDGGERIVGSYRQPWQRFFVAPKSSETSEFIEMPSLNALIEGGAAGTMGAVPLRLIWGTAEYNDVFGKKHWLRWCYRIRPSRPVIGQGIKISFIQWGDYNGSSDEAD